MGSDSSAKTKFGAEFLRLRNERGWTARELIAKLAQANKTVSPAYITRIEQHGEIPSPEFIHTLAKVLDCDVNKLLECAKKSKLENMKEYLDEKYGPIDTLQKKVERGKLIYGSEE
jgi:transcriptional regulator with XRE-family HTH domain